MDVREQARGRVVLRVPDGAVTALGMAGSMGTGVHLGTVPGIDENAVLLVSADEIGESPEPGMSDVALDPDGICMLSFGKRGIGMMPTSALVETLAPSAAPLLGSV